MTFPPVFQICPLCGHPEPEHSLRGPGGRLLLFCPQCHLLFAPQQDLPTPEQETIRYQQHQNHLGDEGYRRFLLRLAVPVCRFLQPGANGLDFGCGPTPSLSRIMQDMGWACQRFDPLFAPQTPSGIPFDFLLASECLEHMHQPLAGWQRMLSWTRPGSILGFMTERWASDRDLTTWSYARDFTHVVFYHTRTFQYLADRWDLVIREDDGERVVVMERAQPGQTGIQSDIFPCSPMRAGI